MYYSLVYLGRLLFFFFFIRGTKTGTFVYRVREENGVIMGQKGHGQS